MALNDLLESLERAASTLDRLRAYQEYAIVWRDIGTQIKRAMTEGRIDVVKHLLVESIASDYFKTMGAFNDLIICTQNRNVPADMSEDEANDLLEKAKEDLLFNLLFWDTDKNKASRIYNRTWKRINEPEKKRYAQEYRKYEKMKARGVETPLPAPPSPFYLYFHFNPWGFESWTDWGKLVSDPALHDALEREGYFRSRTRATSP